MALQQDQRRTALGEALRVWRARVLPSEAELSDRLPERRVPGLRRSEVAVRAGISVDYVIRLEQGRVGIPSPQVLDALSDALRLDSTERELLYTLSGAAPPPRLSLMRTTPVRLQRLLLQFEISAAAVFTRAWDLLDWNATWAELMGDPRVWSPQERNLAWEHFVHSALPLDLDTDGRKWLEHDLAAKLRASKNLYPADERLAEVVVGLRLRSDAFARNWDDLAIPPCRNPPKTVAHPEFGAITLDADLLTPADTDLVLMVMHAAPGSGDAARLRQVHDRGLLFAADRGGL